MDRLILMIAVNLHTLQTALLWRVLAAKCWSCQNHWGKHMDKKCTRYLQIYLNLEENKFTGPKQRATKTENMCLPLLPPRPSQHTHTPQQFIEECGLLFPIRVKPQRDLDSLLLSIVREHGCWLALHNAPWSMTTCHTKSISLFSGTMWCASMLFLRVRNCSKRGRSGNFAQHSWKTGLETIMCSNSLPHL